MSNILICDDEPDIVSALKIYLTGDEYQLFEAYNGRQALETVESNEIHLVLLDIMMPGKDGIQVLKTARAEGVTTPALFLTAKAEVADRVAGLDAGADDYLPKPFAASEFLARVRALVRRSSVYAPALLTVGNTTLDGDQYMLKAPADSVRLNNKEYQLTELFFRHPRQVFSSAHLFEKIWGLDSQAEMDVVWTYISFLRRKLKQIGADVEIRTIRGAGYALEEMPC